LGELRGIGGENGRELGRTGRNLGELGRTGGKTTGN